MFTTRFEAWVRRHAEALMTALGRTPLTPNQVTVVGVALTFLAAGLVAFGHLRWAGVVLIMVGAALISYSQHAKEKSPNTAERQGVERQGAGR